MPGTKNKARLKHGVPINMGSFLPLFLQCDENLPIGDQDVCCKFVRLSPAGLPSPCTQEKPLGAERLWWDTQFQGQHCMLLAILWMAEFLHHLRHPRTMASPKIPNKTCLPDASKWCRNSYPRPATRDPQVKDLSLGELALPRGELATHYAEYCH